MAATLVPSAQLSFPASLTAPQNGETLDASVEQVLDQALLDGTAAARLALFGSVGRRGASCSDNATIIVRAPGSVVLKNGAGFWRVEQRLTDFGAYTPAGIIASTGYYLYLQDDGAGALEVIHSTNPPDAALAYENGAQLRAFTGCYFSTNAAGAILNFESTGLSTVIQSRPALGGGVSGNLMLDQGAATVNTAVNFTAAVPPRARTVQLDAYAQTSDMTSQLVIVYDGIATRSGLFLNIITNRPASGFMPLAPQGGATFNYFGSSANCATSVYCAGFSF